MGGWQWFRPGGSWRAGRLKKDRIEIHHYILPTGGDGLDAEAFEAARFRDGDAHRVVGALAVPGDEAQFMGS